MDYEKRDAFVAEFRRQAEEISRLEPPGPIAAENIYAQQTVPLLHIVFEQGERLGQLEDQITGLLGG